MKKNEELSNRFDKAKEKTMMMMKKKKMKNMSRLGGNGLSLNAFANAKSKNNPYNPSLIKKQREFYKNAKNVNKFKKLLKQQHLQSDHCSTQSLIENENEPKEDKDMSEGRRKKKISAFSLEELYKKQHVEKEKERMEREAFVRAKKEEREKAEARRKAMREKMLKKTRTGQPVMKYRIEHLLESIQGSNKISADKKS
ncbi:stress response protein NST1-like [Abrus precatorius]|uniref:Stress response protein NST1-like n=1 Tax=Abrus precatorius TaxID=3816 RepID=A0A8B8MEJ5_ABRPR|nr:stress response protein NST1-like [Abrus precatorius]